MLFRQVIAGELAEALWPEALLPSWTVALSAVVSRLRTRLAGLGMLVIAAWGVLRLRGGRIPAAVERRLLSVVVGAASVFLITSRLPGELGRFVGFDDAMNLVGARLLSKGYFPWRDFLFIHGLWTDALQGTVGFTVFGDTRWGSQAGTAVLLIPCVWVIAYLFAVWISRENPLFLVGIGVVLLSGVLDSPPGLLTFPDVRFIIVPVSLELLPLRPPRRAEAKPLDDEGVVVLLLTLLVGPVVGADPRLDRH